VPRSRRAGIVRRRVVSDSEKVGRNNRYWNPSEVNAVKLIVTLQQDETGMIVAECPAIPGCISQGKTEEETLANIREAVQRCLEVRAAKGMPLTVAIREIEVSV
jgi:predicted RNase H-like HicB family nuclease